MAERLLEEGASNFSLECLDLNPYMLERGRRRGHEKRLLNWVTFTETDVNSWEPRRPYDVVMANQSLHHFVQLESIFTHVRHALTPDGFFLIDEMIGRNGHKRWPEALSLLNDTWRDCPSRYKFQPPVETTGG